MTTKLIYFLTFISGMTIMGIEMAASRLLAPYFGSSVFVWSALIGSVMLFLSLGYYFGGKIADRYPYLWLLFSITLIAGIFTGILPFFTKPILYFSLNTFQSNSYLLLISAIISSLILISLPITLLAMVTPFVLRIMLNHKEENMDKKNVNNMEKTGNISGKIFTISTIGSLAGTFLPVIFLIPNIGTQKTFIFFSIILSALSAIGLFLQKKNYLFFLIPIIFFLLFFISGNKIKNIKGSLYEGESIYNYIQVIENEDGDRELRLEEGYGVHSRYNPKYILKNDVWSYYLYAPFFLTSQSKEKNALVIGLGAGTIPKVFNKCYTDYMIDGVEIDSMVVAAGKKYFDMNEKNLSIFIDDGRFFLRRTNDFYDIIMMDAYRLPYIPFHLATKEFFENVYKKLKPGGVLVVNIGRTMEDYRLVHALCKTLKTVYPQVFTFDIPGYSMNTLTFAVKNKVEINELKKKINLDGNINKIFLTQKFLNGINEYNKETDMSIITDDCAPVERIIDSIVIDYVLKNLKS